MSGSDRARASRYRARLDASEPLEPREAIWLAWYDRGDSSEAPPPLEDELEHELDAPEPILAPAESAAWSMQSGVDAMVRAVSILERACASWERLAVTSTDRLAQSEDALVSALTRFSPGSDEPGESAATHPGDAVADRLKDEMVTRLLAEAHTEA